jgi:hypothetical protein
MLSAALAGLNVHCDAGMMREQDRRDLAMATVLFNELQRQYAGHQWGVEVNGESGHVVIRLSYSRGADMKPSKYGVLLHLRNLQDHDGMIQKLRWAGGELLERFNLPRQALSDTTKALAMRHGLDISNPEP